MSSSEDEIASIESGDFGSIEEGEGEDIDSSEEGSEDWFDVLVRRPDDVDMHRRARQHPVLPEATELYTSTYPRPRGGGEIKLVLEGFPADSEQTMFSSGLSCWDASEHLCNYLLTDDELRKNDRLLELGAGLGKCGLLLHHLVQTRRLGAGVDLFTNAVTVLTDGDANALQLLRKNVLRNTRANDNIIAYGDLQWGKEEAREFLCHQGYHHSKFDIIVGSDLLYTNKSNIDPLFDTVGELMEDRGREKFILAHDEKHLVSVKDIMHSSYNRNLFCEVLKQEGSIHLLCFRWAKAWEVNRVLSRLQARISAMENEVSALKISKSLVEDKCKKLDERCVELRGEEDLPESILLAFDEDNVAGIVSFLDLQDFANLSSTCKCFGVKAHKVDGEPVSLLQKVAHKLYEGALPEEKEALRAFNREESPFVFYQELLELRKPLKFDQLLGRGIDHAAGDESRIVRNLCPIKTAPGTEFIAFTAVSNHVMRAGRHYVTFTCPESGTLPSANGNYLWFGIVRPLRNIRFCLQPNNIHTMFFEVC